MPSSACLPTTHFALQDEVPASSGFGFLHAGGSFCRLASAPGHWRARHLPSGANRAIGRLQDDVALKAGSDGTEATPIKQFEPLTVHIAYGPKSAAAVPQAVPRSAAGHRVAPGAIASFTWEGPAGGDDTCAEVCAAKGRMPITGGVEGHALCTAYGSGTRWYPGEQLQVVHSVGKLHLSHSTYIMLCKC